MLHIFLYVCVCVCAVTAPSVLQSYEVWSSFKLRRDSAQPRIRLQSWMLASTDTECWSSSVAHLSLCSTASSALDKAGWWGRVLPTDPKGGAVWRAGVAGGRKLEVAVGTEIGMGCIAGGRPLRPDAAPSQCSGRGWPVMERGGSLDEAPLVSGRAWVASWRSRTCDKAAWAFNAGREI